MNLPIPTAWLSRLLGRHAAGRAVSVKPDDTFVVSYPKSGNTWLRFLIANLTSEHTIDFANIERFVADIYQNSDRTLGRLPSPRYLKSHESYDSRYGRVVYIVRDPRDVAISYYHYLVKIMTLPPETDKRVFIEDFINGRLDSFGSWAGNVGSWLDKRGDDPDFLLVRYEDVLADPPAGLRRIADFLDLKRTDTQIDSAVGNSSFDRMRSHEVAQKERWRPIKRSREDMYFVRRAKSGGWTEELTDDMARKISDQWHEPMARLGYEI